MTILEVMSLLGKDHLPKSVEVVLLEEMKISIYKKVYYVQYA